MPVAVISPGPNPTTSPSQCYIGGYDGSPVPVSTTTLLQAAPGSVFTVDASGRYFYIYGADGNLYVWDSTSSATAATLMYAKGAAGQANTLQGFSLNCITMAGGNIFATTTSNQLLEIASMTGGALNTAIVAGSGTAATTDGVGAAAAFKNPRDICISTDGLRIYVVENVTFNNGDAQLRMFVPATGAVTTAKDPYQGIYFQQYDTYNPVGFLTCGGGDWLAWGDTSGHVKMVQFVAPYTNQITVKGYDTGFQAGPVIMEGTAPTPKYLWAMMASAGNGAPTLALERFLVAAPATKIPGMASSPAPMNTQNPSPSMCYSAAAAAIFGIDSAGNLFAMQE